MKFGHLFIKITQGSYSTGTCLDFIKKKQSFAGCDFLPEEHFKVGTDSSSIKVTFEQSAQGRIALQVCQSKRFKPFFSKIFH